MMLSISTENGNKRITEGEQGFKPLLSSNGEIVTLRWKKVHTSNTSDTDDSIDNIDNTDSIDNTNINKAVMEYINFAQNKSVHRISEKQPEHTNIDDIVAEKIKKSEEITIEEVKEFYKYFASMKQGKTDDIKILEEEIGTQLEEIDNIKSWFTKNGLKYPTNFDENIEDLGISVNKQSEKPIKQYRTKQHKWKVCVRDNVISEYTTYYFSTKKEIQNFLNIESRTSIDRIIANDAIKYKNLVLIVPL